MSLKYQSELDLITIIRGIYYYKVYKVSQQEITNKYEWKTWDYPCWSCCSCFWIFANSENICVFLHRVNCKCLKLVGKNFGNMVVNLFHACTCLHYNIKRNMLLSVQTTNGCLLYLGWQPVGTFNAEEHTRLSSFIHNLYLYNYMYICKWDNNNKVNSSQTFTLIYNS